MVHFNFGNDLRGNFKKVEICFYYALAACQNQVHIMLAQQLPIFDVVAYDTVGAALAYPFNGHK